MRKIRLLLLLSSLGLLLSACGKASLPISTFYTDEELENLGDTIDTPFTDYSVPATSVLFPEEELELILKKGEFYTYNPEILPKKASKAALNWTSRDINIATIDNGVVTAVGPGQTDIFVYSKDNSFEEIDLKVRVEVDITDFNISETTLDLGYGYTAQLEVSYVPNDTTQKGVVFVSEDEDIISVTEDGLVTAKEVDGTTKIRVTSPFINTVKEVTVTVKDKVIHVDDIQISNQIDKIEVDKEANINASVLPGNAENKGLSFASSDESIATIDENGLIKALEPGQVTITVTSNEIPEIQKSFNVDVYQVKADQIVVEPDTLNLIVNEYQQIHLSYKLAGADISPSRTNVSYSIDDDSIASIAVVNNSGLVTAKSVGLATLRITDTELDNAVQYIEVPINVVRAERTYIVNNLADWTPNGGVKVFAFVWGGDIGYPGTWIDVDLDYSGDSDDYYSNVSASFVAPKNIEGFLLVRCNGATITPDWDITTGDVAGRIYNQTGDFAVSGTSYEALEWNEYPKPEQLSGFGFKFTNKSFDIVGNPEGTDPSGRDQYSLSQVEFYAGDTFKLFNFDMNEGWVEEVEGYSFGGSSAVDETWMSYLEIVDDHYLVLVDFVADVFIKVAYGNNSIYFGLNEQPIVINEYKVVIGSQTIALVEKEPTDGELALYQADDIDLVKGESVTFYADDKAILNKIGPNEDDLVNSIFNNYVGSVASGLSVQADAEDASIYLRVWEEGYSFWISGGDSEDHNAPIVPVETYEVTFEMDLSVIKSWENTKDFSLYVYGEDEYHPLSWDECRGNLDSEIVTFNVEEGKALTHAVFYYYEGETLKQSSDIEASINASGSYIVNFVDSWAEVEENVWKLDKLTISIKELVLDKNEVTIEEEGFAVIKASHWTGENLTATSQDEETAVVSLDSATGIITITAVKEGTTKVEVTDGVKVLYIDVTITAKSEAPQKVQITLTSEVDVGYGARLYLVGEFCSWDVTSENAIAFDWVDDHWEVTFEVDAGTVYVCKLVVDDWETPSGLVDWEAGENRTLTFNTSETIVLVWQE